jgi:uncharacterized protein (TIGR03435 family)
VTTSIKFLVPFSLLAAMGSHLRLLLASLNCTPSLPSTLESISYPFAPLDISMAATKATNVPPSHGAAVVPAVLVALWLFGSAAILFARWVQWRRLNATVRKALTLHGGREFDALRRLERIVGIRKPVNLIVPPTLVEPGVFGILRPVLLLPVDIAQHLGDSQLDAVLAHELYHVRRRDNFTNASHMLVEAIFWFHPLVWWIGARLVEERERACDEGVLDLGGEPEVYAASLLQICLYYLELPAPFVSSMTGSDLNQRIEHIMTSCGTSRLSFFKKLLLTTGGLAVIVMPLMIGLVNAPRIGAQSAVQQQPAGAAAPLAFEVASVKPAKSVGPRGIKPMPGGQTYIANGAPLRMMIKLMYKIPDSQIVGGPSWMDTELWDIEAKAAYPSSRDQLHEMFKTLLADRFKLQFHRETKDLSAYVLSTDKSGPKIKLNESPESFDIPIHSARGAGPLPKIVGTRVPMQYFSYYLSLLLNAPVVDRTGLDRYYDFTLEWMPEPGLEARKGGAPEVPLASDGPNLFTALREQLGLKLESRKAPVEVFVIDHAEKPEAN